MNEDVAVDDLVDEVGPAWRARTGIVIALAGLIGLCASFILSIDAFELAANPSARFGCDVNAILSCSTVAMTPQASVFGFPNALLGLSFGAVVVAYGAAVAAGTRFARWYVLGMEALCLGGLGFAIWLFGQSYFVIHVLCPWCLVVFTTTLIVLAGASRLAIIDGAIRAPGAVRHFVAKGFDWSITGLIVFLVLAMLAVRYGVDVFAA